MARVELHTTAPEFELEDFQGQPFRLSALRGEARVVLVFNRGFL
jgi:peroxiredoxin